MKPCQLVEYRKVDNELVRNICIEKEKRGVYPMEKKKQKDQSLILFINLFVNFFILYKINNSYVQTK